MKILFACHRLPYPPNRGGKIRPFNMIQHLSQRHQVVVASLAHTQQELLEGEPLNGFCQEVIAEVLPDSTRWLQAGLSLLSSRPSSVAYFSAARLHARVAEAARRICFDAVMVHCAFAAQYVLNIPAKFRLMDFGDLDSGKWFDYEKTRGIPICYGYGIEARKLRRYETAIAQQFDYCTVTTQGEAEEFKKLAVSRPHSVIPNGVDTKYFQFNRAQNKRRPVIAFLGRMDYFPNIDGVLYFTKSILPIIRQSLPEVEFRIVGSDPVHAIQQLAREPGVTVTGHVKDVRPYMEEAAVSVAPLRLARGTQNKILESMAMGVPVVATAQAAKGIHATPGTHLLVGDDEQSFARQVMEILSNDARRDTLAAAALEHLRGTYSWDASMKILDGVLAQAQIA